MSVIKQIKFKEVVRPLRTTFATALGEKRVMRSMIVTVLTGGGAAGSGEVPTSAAFKSEDIAVIGRVLHQAAERLKGAEIEGWASLVARLRMDFPQARMTLSGLETALFRADMAEKGVVEHIYWGGRAKGSIRTSHCRPFRTARSSPGGRPSPCGRVLPPIS